MTYTVLVIDDDIPIQELITEALEDEGYWVRTARSGSEALELVAAKPPDLVLLDQFLPGLSGYELIQQLRASASVSPLPIVIVTADATAADRLEALGVDTCLIKPFSLDDLIGCIEEHLPPRVRVPIVET